VSLVSRNRLNTDHVGLTPTHSSLFPPRCYCYHWRFALTLCTPPREFARPRMFVARLEDTFEQISIEYDSSLLCLQQRAEILLQLRLVVTPYVTEVVVAVVIVIGLLGEARRRLIFFDEALGRRWR